MKLLVCLDNTNCSQIALENLRLTKMAQGAQVCLLHILSDSEDQEEGDSFLRSMASSLERASSVEIRLAKGPIADTILSIAQSWQADLIILGTHDRRALDRLFLGSVSQHVLSHADSPVLILRNKSVANNVLVAVDDSETSSACLEWLSRQRWVATSNICMLSITNELPSFFDSQLMSTASASELLLKRQFKESRLLHLSQVWSELFARALQKVTVPFAVVDGEPAEAIISTTKKWPINLVVLGSHGRSGLSKLIHGSVSETIAAGVSCSVLVVRGETATRFENARQSVLESNELGLILSEKPHPAKVSSLMPGSGFNGFFPNSL